jgi:NAD(P) transhydrogenase subunit alpha
VKLVAFANLPARVAADATSLYARNLLSFTGLLAKDGVLNPDFDDEILRGACLTRDGQVVHPALQPKDAA